MSKNESPLSVSPSSEFKKIKRETTATAKENEEAVEFRRLVRNLPLEIRGKICEYLPRRKRLKIVEEADAFDDNEDGLKRLGVTRRKNKKDDDDDDDDFRMYRGGTIPDFWIRRLIPTALPPSSPQPSSYADTAAAFAVAAAISVVDDESVEVRSCRQISTFRHVYREIKADTIGENVFLNFGEYHDDDDDDDENDDEYDDDNVRRDFVPVNRLPTSLIYKNPYDAEFFKKCIKALKRVATRRSAGYVKHLRITLTRNMAYDDDDDDDDTDEYKLLKLFLRSLARTFVNLESIHAKVSSLKQMDMLFRHLIARGNDDSDVKAEIASSAAASSSSSLSKNKGRIQTRSSSRMVAATEAADASSWFKKPLKNIEKYYVESFQATHSWSYEHGPCYLESMCFLDRVKQSVDSCYSGTNNSIDDDDDDDDSLDNRNIILRDGGFVVIYRGITREDYRNICESALEDLHSWFSSPLSSSPLMQQRQRRRRRPYPPAQRFTLPYDFSIFKALKKDVCKMK